MQVSQFGEAVKVGDRVVILEGKGTVYSRLQSGVVRRPGVDSTLTLVKLDELLPNQFIAEVFIPTKELMLFSEYFAPLNEELR